MYTFQAYYFRELVKYSTALCLTLIVIYLLMETAIRCTIFSIEHYLFLTSRYFYWFLFFSLAFSTTYVYYKAKISQEILALFNLGVSKRVLLVPVHLLIVCSLFLSMLNYLFCLPYISRPFLPSHSLYVIATPEAELICRRSGDFLKDIYWTTSIGSEAKKILHAHSGLLQSGKVYVSEIEEFTTNGCQLCPSNKHTQARFDLIESIHPLVRMPPLGEWLWLLSPFICIYPISAFLLSYRNHHSWFFLSTLQFFLLFTTGFVIKIISMIR